MRIKEKRMKSFAIRANVLLLDKHTKESPLTEMQIEKIRTCETVRSTEEKGCAIRNSQWADRIRERFMKKE